MKCQGNILVNDKELLPDGDVFWKKYSELAKEFEEEERGRFWEAMCCKYNSKYEEAMNLLEVDMKAI